MRVRARAGARGAAVCADASHALQHHKQTCTRSPARPTPSSSANDAYDTIDWIVAQNWSNGVVYLTGVSADGLEDFATISNPHPAARAQFAMWAGTSGYDMIMPGGAIRESLVKDWLSLVDLFNASAVIAEAYSHEAPDSWWDILNGTKFFKNVDWPSVAWGGW